MPRVKGGVVTRRRHKKILKMAEGYLGSKSRRYRIARQQLIKSGVYAYRDRRNRKRDFRRLWVIRINAAARQNGLSYSRLINGLRKAGVAVNRKMLAELAVSDQEAFARLAATARDALAQEPAAVANA
ncbi:MAG: 50S ribosomal protein L20 [Limnochordales bacterium]|nr:50S ribosomal protein L20 [Limnochordales bacterium]